MQHGEPPKKKAKVSTEENLDNLFTASGTAHKILLLQIARIHTYHTRGSFFSILASVSKKKKIKQKLT